MPITSWGVATKLSELTIDNAPALATRLNSVSGAEGARFCQMFRESIDFLAQIFNQTDLTADVAASIWNDDLMDVSFCVSIINNANLSTSKVASIFDSTNLAISKVISILEDANISADKAQAIMYAMDNLSRLMDIITNGASDLTVSSDTTISDTNRYGTLTINSGVTLTLDGQPNVIICSSLVNNGILTKTLTGGAGGAAYTSPGDGGQGAGGLIIIAKNIDNNDTIQANGENGENGGTTTTGGSGKDGTGSAIHRIGTDTVGAGGDGGYTDPDGKGEGLFGGGGGGWSGPLRKGGDGGAVTYTDYTTASDLYTEIKKATIDWWLANVESKSPTTTVSFPDIAGSGGGGGAEDADDLDSGGGGGSGGEIIVVADSFDNTGGTIQANGANGGNGGTEGAYDAAGGGGGGGMVYCLYKTLVASGTLSASGGSGGTGDYNGDAGTSGTAKTYAI